MRWSDGSHQFHICWSKCIGRVCLCWKHLGKLFKLGGQGDSLNEQGGEEEPSTWGWEHAIIWVIYYLLGRMDGSDLMDEGSGWYAGMCEETRSESIVVWVLFEQGGNCAILEVVFQCMN